MPTSRSSTWSTRPTPCFPASAETRSISSTGGRNSPSRATGMPPSNSIVISAGSGASAGSAAGREPWPADTRPGTARSPEGAATRSRSRSARARPRRRRGRRRPRSRGPRPPRAGSRRRDRSSASPPRCRSARATRPPRRTCRGRPSRRGPPCSSISLLGGCALVADCPIFTGRAQRDVWTFGARPRQALHLAEPAQPAFQPLLVGEEDEEGVVACEGALLVVEARLVDALRNAVGGARRARQYEDEAASADRDRGVGQDATQSIIDDRPRRQVLRRDVYMAAAAGHLDQAQLGDVAADRSLGDHQSTCGELADELGLALERSDRKSVV